LVKARQEAGCSDAGFFVIKRALPLERLFLGVTETFAAFFGLGGVMIPLGGVGRFQSRFSVGVVGQEVQGGSLGYEAVLAAACWH
jgi:hypothetical protein